MAPGCPWKQPTRSASAPRLWDDRFGEADSWGIQPIHSRPRPRLHLPRLHRAARGARSTMLKWIGRTADKPTSLTNAWPAAHITASSNAVAGAPENAKTAAPNGSHHHTSMAANHGSTTTTRPPELPTARRRRGVVELALAAAPLPRRSAVGAAEQPAEVSRIGYPNPASDFADG
jgi:hypothetical protein